MSNLWTQEFTKKLTYILPKKAKIIEAGSRNINGSNRVYFESIEPEEYIGIDIIKGEGVDLVLNVCNLETHFESERFDCALSTEMLEHCENWQDAVIQLVKVVKVGGLILITTRSPGFDLHGYPNDHNRFTSQDMKNIFEGVGEIIALEDDMTLNYPCGIGVLLKRTLNNSSFNEWQSRVKKIKVTKATSIIFNSKDENNLTQQEREECIFTYFMDLVSRREEEIRRLHESLNEQTNWALNLKKINEVNQAEIFRLNKLISEISEAK